MIRQQNTTEYTYYDSWLNIIKRMSTLNRIITSLLLSITFAGITGLFAQIKFYLPFTPVPVTGQVFAVLIASLMLGKGLGSLSQFFYIGFGILGIPWFVIGPIGPTGGYLVGFIVAPVVIGFVLDSLGHRGFGSLLFSLIAGVFTIYLFGLFQFCIFTGLHLNQAIMLAVIPFLPFDIAKAVIAAMIMQKFVYNSKIIVFE